MNLDQAKLIKRTAWMHLQILDRGPSEDDAKYVPAAVKMLTLVACMGYAVLDLEEALAEAGKLRHLVKQHGISIRRIPRLCAESRSSVRSTALWILQCVCCEFLK